MKYNYDTEREYWVVKGRYNEKDLYVTYVETKNIHIGHETIIKDNYSYSNQLAYAFLFMFKDRAEEFVKRNAQELKTFNMKPVKILVSYKEIDDND